MKYLAILFIAGMLLLAGCAQTGAEAQDGNSQDGAVAQDGGNGQTQETDSQAQTDAEAQDGGNGQAQETDSQAQTQQPPAQIQKNDTKVETMASNNPIVIIETNKGKIVAEIYKEDAPITAGNFLTLVQGKFYDGLSFHRVVDNFVIQGGDPKGDGTGGSDKTIPLEVKPSLRHEYGTLAMARSQNPDSASSQFYIVKGEASFLDGQYAVFGKVTEGMDVVEKIAVGDTMSKVYVQQ